MSPRLSLSELFLRRQTDQRLATLAAEGHGRAFALLVERHRPVLEAHARRIVGPGRAEDVVQEAFLRAWSAFERGNAVQHPSAWLHRIVHNAALTEVERPLSVSEPLDEALADPLSTGAVERRLEVRELLTGLAGLSERQRLALLGSELEGRSRRQLAAELGLTEGAVRQLVHRARASMRASVAALAPTPVIVRIVRPFGWLDGRRGTAAFGPAARAGASAAFAGGGTAKVAASLLVAGALGGSLVLDKGLDPGRHTRSPTLSSHHARFSAARQHRTLIAGAPAGAVASAPEPIAFAPRSTPAQTGSTATRHALATSARVVVGPSSSSPREPSSPQSDPGEADSADGTAARPRTTTAGGETTSPGRDDSAVPTAPRAAAASSPQATEPSDATPPVSSSPAPTPTPAAADEAPDGSPVAGATAPASSE